MFTLDAAFFSQRFLRVIEPA